MGTTEHPQSVRNAWINRLRDEALRMRRAEVSKIVSVGVWIGTYADADGTNAFPSTKTLAAIAGCTEETVTRCVKVLMAVGLLLRKRRPNQSSMYLLVVPLGKPVPWEEHLYLYTDTRQARRKKEKKAEELAAYVTEQAAQDEARNPFPTGVPRNPDTVLERCPTPFRNGFRNPFPPGGTITALPSVGTRKLTTNRLTSSLNLGQLAREASKAVNRRQREKSSRACRSAGVRSAASR